jgi:iron complex outermembrane receptor protein
MFDEVTSYAIIDQNRATTTKLSVNLMCVTSKFRFFYFVLYWIVSLFFYSTNALANPESPDTKSVKPTNSAIQNLTNIPLEELVDMDVTSASKVARQISDAPSAVSIVTSDDIRAYGYRSIADIVNSMPGVYTPYDRSIYYLGGRGFGRSGDYVGRVLLMIDGYATNDNIYNEAYIGNDGLVDADLIERVEYIPGTGSSIYGNGAFLGIINIITKKGSDFNGTQISAEVGSYGSRKGRITFGKQLENGADVLLSASLFKSDGQNFFFPEFNNVIADPNFTINHGVARNQDLERSPRLFAKIQFEGWTLEGGYVSRKHNNPTGAYNALFNNYTADWDTNGYINLTHNDTISANLIATTRLYYGQYLDRTAITDQTATLLHEHNSGQWAGVDTKFVGDWFDNHKFVFGMEFRDDYKLHFKNAFNDAEYSRNTFSLYLQDEIHLSSQLRLNIGGRYDDSTNTDDHFSPRVALIYSPSESNTFKLSHSSAYRTPSAYEQFYRDSMQIPNPKLKSEYVETTEFVLQHQFSDMTQLSSTLYHYETSDLIVNNAVGTNLNQNQNAGFGHTDGIEISMQKIWGDGLRMRGSYTFQRAIDSANQHLINSPENLAKYNVTFPILNHTLRTGLEVQYTDDRITESLSTAPSYTLTNLTFTTERPIYHTNASLSIRNLFNTHYVAVAPADYVQDTLQMDGVNAWLQLTYDIQ